MGCMSSSPLAVVRPRFRLARARARARRPHALLPPPPPRAQDPSAAPATFRDAPGASPQRGGGGAGVVAKRQPFGVTWKLKEKLGKGNYATVYRVVHNVSGFEAAVKCILKAPLTKEDLEALAVEVKAMELLRDTKSFVKILDFYNEKDHFYIVLELISGGELLDRIVKRSHYSEADARVVVQQMAAGIATAHARHICHRDLKPENVLLASRTDDTLIKLADLGFAKISQAANELMTTPCGTPGYVAPEVISERPYTAACDMWSLGVIVYILLVG